MINTDMQLDLPKVLIVDLSKFYGGATSRVLSIIANSQPGTIALAGLENSALAGQARRLGLPVHIVGSSKADPLILYRLIHLIRKEGFKLLDTQNIQSKFWASLAAGLTDTALVSTLNSWYTDEHSQHKLKGRTYLSLELLTNKPLDLYIAVSEKDRQRLLQSGLPADKIRLVYNAIELDPSTVQADRQWLTSKFAIPEDAIICTAVGRLVHQKAHDILIQAIEQIADLNPRLFCVIIGEGENEAALRAQIQNADLQDRVHLAGYQDRKTVLCILKSSDIFVMASRYEGTPIALLEAASLGLPIMATTGGGIPELVTNEKEALLVPPEDPTAFAHGLLRISMDQGFARTLADNARLRIQQQFDIPSQVRATWDAYALAFKAHKKRDGAEQ